MGQAHRENSNHEFVARLLTLNMETGDRMTTMWDTGKISISDLMDRISTSKIALPQFQRLSVWTKADWMPFLVSVLLDRPTGTLLLLEAGSPKDTYAPRVIKGAPPLTKNMSELKWLLLDGQQRITTLFKAFVIGDTQKNGKSKEFVLNVKGVLENKALEEKHLELTSSVKGYADLAKEGKIALKTLLNEAQLLSWLNAYAHHHLADEFEILANGLRDYLPGFQSLRNYNFPMLEIKDSAPPDVVVEIFEGMNRRGQKLNQFDLMVARLYKKLKNGSNYDLRQEWESALAGASSLENLGITASDGMLPLQLIAMQVSRLKPNVRPQGVKGLNNKDVLELPAKEIIGVALAPPIIKGLEFKQAVEALDDAADFLRRICGVTCKQLLPQKSMLIPIADQYLRPKGSRLSEMQLKKWFFAVGLSLHYYGSVNSYAERDCKDLATWADSTNKDAEPTTITNFNSDYIHGLNLKQPMQRVGTILGSSLMCLLVSAGALDWTPGQLAVANTTDDVDFHHMIPEKLLKNFLPSSADRRPIAVMTPISVKANRSIGYQDPKTVIQGLGKDAKPILKTHQVDIALLREGADGKMEFEKFLDSREKLLKTFIIQTLGL